MSLVGSLEDLGLVDILQIVSLSRKSGMLMLRSESGDGRIVLREGLVQGAMIKGLSDDLRTLLVSQGGVDAGSFDRAREVAGAQSLDLDEALGRECGVTADQLLSLRRRHVEQSVMRMLAWRTGEFSFEIREELSDEDRELLLPMGLNTQYLAMEATRLGDELQRGPIVERESREAEEVGELVFSGEEVPIEEDAAESLALATASRVDSADVEIAAAPVGDTRIPVEVAGAGEPAVTSAHLIAIDPDLSSLEWLKASVDGLFQRVHIFQRRDAALDRIRQYLVRGTVPIVLMAEETRGRRSELQGFIARLRALAPAMPILALRPEHAENEPPKDLDSVVLRPSSPSPDPDRWHLYAPLAERLRGDLTPWLRGEGDVSARRQARDVLRRLKRVSDRLRDPSAQGEVLKLVLEYGAETFGRVVIFMVRADVAVGVAQLGLAATGGPDDDALREIELGPEEMPEVFAQVLERRRAVRGPLTGERDRRLALRLGDAIPADVYVAPIESGGGVAALVYAETHPGSRPLPDTTAFEIVLHEAGLVLDRAVLERALAARS